MLSRTVAPPSPKVPLLFSLNNISANLLNVLGDVHTYINDEVLTYVITLPVVSWESLGFFKLLLYQELWEMRNFCTLTKKNR